MTTTDTDTALADVDHRLALHAVAIASNRAHGRGNDAEQAAVDRLLERRLELTSRSEAEPR